MARMLKVKLEQKRQLGFILKTAVKENENGADTRKHAGF